MAFLFRAEPVTQRGILRVSGTAPVIERPTAQRVDLKKCGQVLALSRSQQSYVGGWQSERLVDAELTKSFYLDRRPSPAINSGRNPRIETELCVICE